MIEGLGFCVIYRARIRPGMEAQYIAAWSTLTSLIRAERGGLGSRLHKGADGIWYAYAQWPSAQARSDAFALPSVKSGSAGRHGGLCAGVSSGDTT